ncbi:hypothetical protein Avbf_17077 [Armadillidium vulgare]|nr:hypothetical protein Avbf_17077 [Armadillidium vulgare]
MRRWFTIVVKVKSNENGVSEKLFKENILDNLRKASSEVTKLCRTNPIVLQYGKDQFKSIVAHPSKEKIKLRQQSLSDFKELFTKSSKTLFKVAQAHVKLDRTKELRKPMLLPLEDDIKLLKNYIYKEISNINMLNEWTKEVFIKARRLSVCFLTFLNARRSGEASALTIENINEARENKWVDTQRLKSSVKSSAQKSLVENTKIAFLYGKGNRLVAVTIPVVLIPIIEKLVDPNIRTTCDIDKNNKYAFPSTDTPTNFEESSSDEGILDTQEVDHFSGTFRTLNQTTSEWENETTPENTENSLRTSQDSTSGENDSSFHKVCHKRKYNKWNIQDTETILEYFSESIGMSAIPSM